ncbi:MAG: hypothetical protein IJ594_04985, partial [Oscillospiraceae bacterium]|nr:hypothetical protein [Oscillospiraceae bacterium]
LLDAMDGVRQDYITEAAALLGYGAAPKRRVRGRLARTVLLAAAIAALLGVTAYAAASIHQRRQEELKSDLRIEENHVSDYVQVEAVEAGAGAPGATLLSVQPSYDGFLRFYLDVYPVPEEYARDGLTGESGGDWDVRGVHYFTSLDDEGWQEAFVHIRADGYAEEDMITVDDEDTGVSFRQPSPDAILRRQLAEGYDAETRTLTIECVLNRDQLPADAAEARVHVICAEYLANVDETGRETENDAGVLIDFGTVTVPLAETAVRTVTFTQPRAFSFEGVHGTVSGRFTGAELNADGVVWLYEMDTSYDGEDLLKLTDAFEADAVLELADGSTKAVSLSVRSEFGPVLRDYCGLAGTVDVEAVVGVTAGGVHYELR